MAQPKATWDFIMDDLSLALDLMVWIQGVDSLLKDVSDAPICIEDTGGLKSRCMNNER